MIALFPNCAFLSETSRMLAVARALRERGEEVALASQGGPYEGLLDESGLPWTRLSPGMGREEASTSCAGSWRSATGRIRSTRAPSCTRRCAPSA